MSLTNINGNDVKTVAVQDLMQGDVVIFHEHPEHPDYRGALSIDKVVIRPGEGVDVHAGPAREATGNYPGWVTFGWDASVYIETEAP